MINTINSIINQFNKQYTKVFNADNTIKACGREECKNLILIANSIDNTTNFGNVNTGFIDIQNINKIYKLINNQ